MNWKANRWFTAIKCGFLWLGLGACQNPIPETAPLPFYEEATFTPHWLSANDPALDTFHTIGAFELVNQLGDTITEQTFKDKIYIADFFFTSCPGICPKMTANMAGLQTVFAQDEEVLLLSHSVTPEHDSVPILQAYAEAMGVQASKWHLVTGSRQMIYTLGRYRYFVEEDLGLDKTAEAFLHTENFVLIDGQQRIRGIYNGLNKAALDQLVADVRLLQQAS